MEDKQETGFGEVSGEVRVSDTAAEEALPPEPGTDASDGRDATGAPDGAPVGTSEGEPVGTPEGEPAGAPTDGAADPAEVPSDPEAKVDGADGRQGRNVAASLLDYMEIFAFSVAAVLVIFTLLFRLCRVDGSSMRKTLENGQMLITTSIGEPEQGDIIVFSMTTDSPYYDLNEALVKRVIAKGGQTVRIDCNTGTVYVDGRELTEKYAELLDRNGNEIGQVQQFPTYGYNRETRIFEATVPEGCLFVMGDNRNHSTDSRTTVVGMVDARRVLGRVVLRLSPFTTDFD